MKILTRLRKHSSRVRHRRRQALAFPSSHAPASSAPCVAGIVRSVVAAALADVRISRRGTDIRATNSTAARS